VSHRLETVRFSCVSSFNRIVFVSHGLEPVRFESVSGVKRCVSVFEGVLDTPEGGGCTGRTTGMRSPCLVLKPVRFWCLSLETVRVWCVTGLERCVFVSHGLETVRFGGVTGFLECWTHLKVKDVLDEPLV
jgi:hypothetical protein